MTGGFGVTCLRLVLVSSALTVHFTFSSFLVVARRHYRYSACDIACDSHGIEDEIRAMVSSYMVPKDDEDSELAIG